MPPNSGSGTQFSAIATFVGAAKAVEIEIMATNAARVAIRVIRGLLFLRLF
jgi:hypothetical protein